MPIPVYYNFSPITVNLAKDDYKTAEIILTSLNKYTNVKLNDINYVAHSLYITKGPTAGFLVIKCVSDPLDMNSNVLYFAIPLSIPTDSNAPNSDVDKLMAGGTVVLDLQKYLTAGEAMVSPSLNRAITVVPSSFSIPVQTSLVGSYSAGAIPNLQLNAKTPAMISKQDLDWVMSCDLLDENDNPYPNPTMTDSVKTVDTANTITFLMMALMIAGAAHLIGPVVYNMGGLYNLAEIMGLNNDNGSNKPNHYTINVYWNVLLIIAAVFCVIKGGLDKKDLYYFLAVGLVFAYFSATSAILKLDGVANDSGTGFKNNTGMFKYYSSLFSANSELTVIGKLPEPIRVLSATLLGLGLFAGLILMILGVSMKNEEIKPVLFSVGIFSYLALPAISMLLVGGFCGKAG